LAPEVIIGQGEIDLKTDIWSLGVLLYLLVYGTVPYEA
jgi:serine/threonine protein kinase